MENALRCKQIHIATQHKRVTLWEAEPLLGLAAPGLIPGTDSACNNRERFLNASFIIPGVNNSSGFSVTCTAAQTESPGRAQKGLRPLLNFRRGNQILPKQLIENAALPSEDPQCFLTSQSWSLAMEVKPNCLSPSG